MRAHRVVEEGRARIVGKELACNPFGPVVVSCHIGLCVLPQLHRQEVADRHLQKARICHILPVFREIRDPGRREADSALLNQ